MTTVSQARLGKWFEETRAEHVALGMEQGIERGIQQGIERGIERGIQQGMERGGEQERARGLARLRRHADIKFGESGRPSGWRICSAAPSPPSRWNAWATGSWSADGARTCWSE